MIIINKSDIRYFERAKLVAQCSDYKKIHLGCVAVYKGNIIGMGCNLEKTHPIQRYYNKYRYHPQNTLFQAKLHAEINCLNSIRHLNINFSKVKLYIYRQRRDQDFGLARPCPSCMAAIKDLGIKDIFYTSNDGFVQEKIIKGE